MSKKPEIKSMLPELLTLEELGKLGWNTRKKMFAAYCEAAKLYMSKRKAKAFGKIVDEILSKSVESDSALSSNSDLWLEACFEVAFNRSSGPLYLRECVIRETRFYKACAGLPKDGWPEPDEWRLMSV